MSLARPIFLIAVPQMGDPNFARSVILLLHHDETGALGLVVNHPTEMDLGSFAEAHDFSCHTRLTSSPVFRGGPIEPDRGWILHQDASIQDEQQVLPGLYVSGAAETLEQLLEKGSTFRLLLGYAGWGAAQLEAEMAQGAWLTVEAEGADIFASAPADLWTMVMAKMGVDPSRLTHAAGVH